MQHPSSVRPARLSIDDVDEHVRALARRCGFNDGTQRMGCPTAATDDPAVVIGANAQLKHCRAVVLLKLLDRHSLRIIDQAFSQVLEQPLGSLACHLRARQHSASWSEYLCPGCAAAL